MTLCPLTEDDSLVVEVVSLVWFLPRQFSS
jgi:hypothetical protein